MDDLFYPDIPNDDQFGEDGKFYIGTLSVGAASSATSATVKFNNIPGTPTRACRKQTGVTYSANTRVLIVGINGTYFILEKIS